MSNDELMTKYNAVACAVLSATCRTRSIRWGQRTLQP